MGGGFPFRSVTKVMASPPGKWHLRAHRGGCRREGAAVRLVHSEAGLGHLPLRCGEPGAQQGLGWAQINLVSLRHHPGEGQVDLHLLRPNFYPVA